jgi:GDPmannose 4,6-dehydratase
MEKPRVSMVVGSGGQDGHYLSELLRARGDEVLGITRSRCVSSRSGSLGAMAIVNRAQVSELIAAHRPDEIYYLAAAHGAAESDVEDPHATFESCHALHVTGWLNFLDAVERQKLATRLFYAASSHVFGEPATSPQSELTPLAPVCAYGITKAAGIGLCRMYRRTSAIFCAAGILYNHESPRRKLPFVSRKIVQAAADIKLGIRRTLTLGNLSAAVDWGAAEDYTDAMTRILRLDSPRDFVIASGQLHTVKQFVEAAFSAVDLAWEEHVVQDGSILKGVQRPVPLLGDAGCLRNATGWRPSLDFAEMVRRMVSAELKTRAEL